MTVLFQGGITKRAQLRGEEQGSGMEGKGLISRNRKAERREKQIK